VTPMLNWAGWAAQLRAVAVGAAPLERDILAYFAEVFTKAAAGAELAFDESAVIDVLGAVWAANPPADPAARLLTALATGVQAEWLEMTGLERFYESVGGSYEPDWDQGVLWQMVGGVFLRAGEALRGALG